MAEKLTLADVVESALLEKIEELKRVDQGFEDGRYILPMALRNKVDDPDKMVEDLYGIVALMRQPQEPKYWPEASKKHPVEFPQFVQNQAARGYHSSGSTDECTVHAWFGLTYAGYLVWPRSLMQEMPEEWQAKFVSLATEFEKAFPGADGNYQVTLREGGKYKSDPLSNYRRSSTAAIAKARGLLKRTKPRWGNSHV